MGVEEGRNSPRVIIRPSCKEQEEVGPRVVASWRLGREVGDRDQIRPWSTLRPGARRIWPRAQVHRKLLWETMRKKRSTASHLVVSDRPGGDCVAMASVRYSVNDEPEHDEPVAPLPVSERRGTVNAPAAG